MKQWLITDTHFCHQAMTRLCGRPPDFDTRIDKAVRQLVGADDILIHLGDILLGGKGDAWVHEHYIAAWPGRKILVRGNHDHRSLHWYMQHGWSFACDEIAIEMYGKKLLLTHRPALGDHFDLNIHGHCHDKEFRESLNDDRHLLYAMERTNYQPVLLSRVAQDCRRII